MTNKEIHISLSPHQKNDIQELLNKDQIEKEVISNGNRIDITINMEDERNLEEIERELSSLIIEVIKKEYLKEYVHKRYEEYYKDEVDNIYNYSLIVFDKMKIVLKDTITRRLFNYLADNNHINLDGFLTFRLKDINIYLSSIIDLALEEYLLKKDKNEFINVLKYFVEMQESKVDLVVVNILKDGSFAMHDQNGNSIENINNEELIKMVIEEEMNYEDYLISTLISICPKKIQILDSLNNEFSKLTIETIKSIFDDKVTITLKNWINFKYINISTF